MKKIIIGCFMILINIYFYAGSSIIGLIPDFAGYILISSGIRECVEERKVYKNIQNFAFAACVFSAVMWVLDITTVTSWLYYEYGAEWGYFIRAISIIFIGLVTYFLINVFEYAAIKYNYAFNLTILRISWLILILLNVGMLLFSIYSALYIWMALGQVLAALWFVIMLYLTFEKAFEASKGKRL